MTFSNVSVYGVCGTVRDEMKDMPYIPCSVEEVSSVENMLLSLHLCAVIDDVGNDYGCGLQMKCFHAVIDVVLVLFKVHLIHCLYMQQFWASLAMVKVSREPHL